MDKSKYLSWSCNVYITRELLNKGFIVVKLKSSLGKFSCGYHDLVNCCGISVTDDQDMAIMTWLTVVEYL